MSSSQSYSQRVAPTGSKSVLVSMSLLHSRNGIFGFQVLAGRRNNDERNDVLQRHKIFLYLRAAYSIAHPTRETLTDLVIRLIDYRRHLPSIETTD